MISGLISNYNFVKDRIAYALSASGREGEEVKIIAATKSQSIETISCLNEIGVLAAGENRVQEFLEKYPCAKDINWHFIGQLQSNKVKYVIDKVSLIHSADRLSLIEEIDRQAGKHNIISNILIEINCDNEQSKGGVSLDDTIEFASQLKEYRNIRLKGLMSVMPVYLNEDRLRYYFMKIKEKYDTLSLSRNLEYLSLGMSNDYELAIRCGSNMVRLGRVLFDKRSNV